MSKIGCPYNNAPIEWFYKTFKNKLVYRYHFMNAKVKQQHNIYLFGTIRPYSSTNWITPFEAQNI